MEWIIFFDGVCNLCQGAVQFVIKRDRKNEFKFASLQSDFAKRQLRSFPLDLQKLSSFVLFDNGKIFTQSTAALKVAKKLDGLWPLLYIFIIIPPFMRDGVYNYIAKNRYKWFGIKESCWVPTAELQEKFLG